MSDKIRFSELVEKIAEETGASKQLIHDLLRETVDLAKEGLAEDGRISLTGLGHFKLKWHDARQGINPQTGETIEIPAQNRVHFKPIQPDTLNMPGLSKFRIIHFFHLEKMIRFN